MRIIDKLLNQEIICWPRHTVEDNNSIWQQNTCLWKEPIQQFHQYKKNEQPPLNSDGHQYRKNEQPPLNSDGHQYRKNVK
jgi:hypothetical protein